VDPRTEILFLLGGAALILAAFAIYNRLGRGEP
jgi:hypothetical protein